MLVGELSKRSGFSRDTIRFYEKNGLINISRKERRLNNFKEYPESVLQRLLTIRTIKNFGFTLNEVSEILTLIDIDAATCGNVLDRFNEKVIRIDEKISELTGIRNLLLEGKNKCDQMCCSEPGEDICRVFISDLPILKEKNIC